MPAHDVAVVVPARLASTRLPDKLLATVGGRPVLAWTLRALQASTLPADRLFVATGDPPLADVARSMGVSVLPTPRDLPSGSHRVAVASTALPAAVSWVVNVQGDEPLLDPHTLEAVVAQCHPPADIVTAVCPLTPDEWRTPSTVKAIVDSTGRALWFTRSPLPHRLASASPTRIASFLASASGPRRHLGLYAFRRDRLEAWLALPPSPMATAAGLEQLAALHAGWHVHTAEVDRPRGPAVDTAADLEAVRAVLTIRLP